MKAFKDLKMGDDVYVVKVREYGEQMLLDFLITGQTETITITRVTLNDVYVDEEGVTLTLPIEGVLRSYPLSNKEAGKSSYPILNNKVVYADLLSLKENLKNCQMNYSKEIDQTIKKFDTKH